MLWHYLKCKNIQKTKFQELQKLVMVNNQNALYAVVKNEDLLKKQDISGLLSSLRLKTPLSKILLLGDILFWIQLHWIILNLMIE